MGRWRVITLESEPKPESWQAKYLAPGCRYLWEEHYGVSRYEDAKRDPWKWATTCQQRPDEAIESRFERRWLRVYTDVIHPGRFHVGIIVDPALAQHSRADRTSIMALAGLRQQRLGLVDWVLDRLDPAQRTLKLLKMAAHWQADFILYEEVGMMSDTFYLNRDVEAYGLNCPIIPVGRSGQRHNLSKDARIAGLVPDFREGRIVFPGFMTDEGPVPSFKYRQLDGQVVDLMAFFVETEYVRWAGEKSLEHEEGLDTLSRIHDPEWQLVHAEDDIPDTDADEAAELERKKRESGEGQFEGRVSRGGGSWFSRL